MDRRTLILTGAAALAGCAAPVAAPAPEQTPLEVGGPPLPIPPPSTPPPPPPPEPPHNPAFLAGPEPVIRPSGDARFDAWREEIMQVWGEGWRPYLIRLLADLRPIVVRPEPAPPAGQEARWFVSRVVTPDRIAEGKRRAADPWLQALARRDGVPVEVITAVWGAETNYGREQGQYDLLAYWATRAAVGDGRRIPDFGEGARMVVAGAPPRSVMRCFPDGSFGQVRWFPRHHAQWSIDGDGDEVVDPWRSSKDALASASNVLKRGWEPGSWVAEIIVPEHPDPQNQRLWEGVRRGGAVRPDYVRRADGRPWSPEDAAGSGQVVQPSGSAGPAFLTLRNFNPIRYLNGTYQGRFPGEDLSTAWGLAIGLLANAIRGEAPPSKPL